MNTSESLSEHLQIFTALQGAYSALLRIPANSMLRAQIQSELAACRDAIAASTGQDPEAVQNRYEQVAAFLMEQL